MVFQGLVFGIAGISSYLVKLSLIIAKFTVNRGAFSCDTIHGLFSARIE